MAAWRRRELEQKCAQKSLQGSALQERMGILSLSGDQAANLGSGCGGFQTQNQVSDSPDPAGREGTDNEARSVGATHAGQVHQHAATAPTPASAVSARQTKGFESFASRVRSVFAPKTKLHTQEAATTVDAVAAPREVSASVHPTLLELGARLRDEVLRPIHGAQEGSFQAFKELTGWQR